MFPDDTSSYPHETFGRNRREWQYLRLPFQEMKKHPFDGTQEQIIISGDPAKSTLGNNQ